MRAFKLLTVVFVLHENAINGIIHRLGCLRNSNALAPLHTPRALLQFNCECTLTYALFHNYSIGNATLQHQMWYIVDTGNKVVWRDMIVDTKNNWKRQRTFLTNIFSVFTTHLHWSVIFCASHFKYLVCVIHIELNRFRPTLIYKVIHDSYRGLQN